eukprot:NODE_2689_length_2165_cov_8.250245.p1 GENE.NODE_2689_length_2165_cov_8.250245~~NODE_2689_length_2165_cov_8.250245.p1  ORF type:complete len:485 (+),score=188.59 NODE_2689_length_2165_cov_8.250245:1-1455(+)
MESELTDTRREAAQRQDREVERASARREIKHAQEQLSQQHLEQQRLRKSLADEREAAAARLVEVRHQVAELWKAREAQTEVNCANCKTNAYTVKKLEMALQEACRDAEAGREQVEREREEVNRLRGQLSQEKERSLARTAVDNGALSQQVEHLSTELSNQKHSKLRFQKLAAELETQRTSKADLDKQLQEFCEHQGKLLSKLEAELEQAQRDLVLERETVVRLQLEIQQLQGDVRSERDCHQLLEVENRDFRTEVDENKVAFEWFFKEIERLRSVVRVHEAGTGDAICVYEEPGIQKERLIIERQHMEVEQHRTMMLTRLELALEQAHNDLCTGDIVCNRTDYDRTQRELRYERELASATALELDQQTTLFRRMETTLDQTAQELQSERRKRRDETDGRHMTEADKMAEILFLRRIDHEIEVAKSEIERDRAQAMRSLAGVLADRADHETDANEAVMLNVVAVEVEELAQTIMEKAGGSCETSK